MRSSQSLSALHSFLRPGNRIGVEHSFREIEYQYDLSAVPVHANKGWRVVHFFNWIWLLLKEFTLTFVGIHLLVYIFLSLVWGTTIYIIENYSQGANLYDISPCSVNGTNVTLPYGAPPCGNPILGIFYVDALFLGLSAFSASALVTVDFSLTTLGTQIFCIFGFILGSVLTTPIVLPVLRLFVSWRKGMNWAHEYKAIRLLLIVIGGYFGFFMFIATPLFAVYCATTPALVQIFRNNNINEWYGGFFLGISSFINAGFSPFNNSVVNFEPYPGFLIFIMVLNFAGNVFFPLFLRLTLHFVTFWTRNEDVKNEGRTLLKNSRHFFMLLFDWKATWALSLFWVCMYLFMWMLFIGLQWNNAVLRTNNLNTGQMLVSTLFQSMQLRNNGFNCQNLGLWSQAVVVSSLFFMYIGSYPEIITVRSTTVQVNEAKETVENVHKSPSQALQSEGKRIVLRSMAIIFLFWVVILIIENAAPAGSMSIAALFEIVSALGIVGLSLGTPGTNYSYSGGLNTGTKVLMMIVMLIGRHRGMPLEVDSAIIVKLRRFKRTQLHEIHVFGMKPFQTHESTSNLGPEFSPGPDSIKKPKGYSGPVHPVQRGDTNAFFAATEEGNVAIVQLGAATIDKNDE